MLIRTFPCPACGQEPWRPEHANDAHDADANNLYQLIEWADSLDA